MQKSIKETYENYKYKYTSKILPDIQRHGPYNIQINKDILYLSNSYNRIYSFNLNNLDSNSNIIKINFRNYLITEYNILYISNYGDNINTVIYKYNNPTPIYNNNKFYARDMCINDNKVYLFGSNSKSNIIIILHENGNQELKIEYKKNTIFNPRSYNPCFNINNSLYTAIYRNIYLISDIYEPKVDKHIRINDTYNYHITTDYYDNILINYHKNKHIDIYSPELEKISTINNKCIHNSNVVYYDKSLYYINYEGNLCKEEYI